MAATDQPARESASIVIGLLLITLGALFLVNEYIGAGARSIGWPLYVILPGIAMLAAGFAGASWRPFLYGGALTTTVGLVLFYQNATAYWVSWAYAWALVAPGSVGLAQILDGTLAAKGELVHTGIRTLGTGLALFAVGAAFFEGVLGLGGRDFGPAGVNAFAIVLIALGVLMLATRVVGTGPGDRAEG